MLERSLGVPIPTFSQLVTFSAPVTVKVWGPDQQLPPAVFGADELLDELLFEFESPPEPGTVPEPPSARTGVAQLAPKIPKAAMATTVTAIRTNRPFRETSTVFTRPPPS